MAEEAEDHIEDVDDDLLPEGEGTQPGGDNEDGPDDSQASTQAPNVEDLARDLGWKPKDQWKGDTSLWTPADDYIRHKVSKGERLYDEVRSTKDTLQRLSKTTAKITERAIAEERERAIDAYRAAVEAGDPDAAWKHTEEIRAIDAQRVEVDEDDASPAAVKRRVDAFKEKNAWYGENEEASAYAESVAIRLAKQGKTHAEQFEAAEKAVKTRFPELFEPERDTRREPPKRGPVVNAPNSRAARPAPRAKGVNDLPPEARKAGEDFVKRGRVKDLATYAATYFEEDEA